MFVFDASALVVFEAASAAVDSTQLIVGRLGSMVSASDVVWSPLTGKQGLRLGEPGVFAALVEAWNKAMKPYSPGYEYYNDVMAYCEDLFDPLDSEENLQGEALALVLSLRAHRPGDEVVLVTEHRQAGFPDGISQVEAAGRFGVPCIGVTDFVRLCVPAPTK